jgi:hypothetical protein
LLPSDALPPVVGETAQAPPIELPSALPPAPPIERGVARTSPNAPDVPLAAPPATERLAELPPEELPALAGVQEFFRSAPAWLVSSILHMLLMLFLGLAIVAQQKVRELAESVVTLEPSDADIGEFDIPGDGDAPFGSDSDEPPMAPGDGMDASFGGGMDAGIMSTGDPTSDLVASEFGDAESEFAPMGELAESGMAPIQLSFSGRGEGMKDAMLRAYGGTAGTESSVTAALKWLARNQQRNGLWSLEGPYSNGAGPENQDAATAMALLAFQGAGYTPDSDSKSPFTTVVNRGWRALLKRQDKDGNFFQQGSSHGRLYTQAFCTIALCELYGMTNDSAYRDRAQKALNYCVSVQSPQGGWRYQPGFDSDTSVSGWFVMALQSARMAGLDVPSLSLTRIGKFLDEVSLDDGAKYSYTPGQGQRLSMCAEGLLCRQYLGWKRDDPRLQRGVKHLLENLPANDNRESYYWYYASQVCHHMEGDAWQRWNAAMRDVVPDTQERDGPERGSWDPSADTGIGAGGGGRLFVTCLHTYMLEVYYRHLPLYQLDVLQAAN